MSSPAQKARPAPARTMARTSSSWAHASRASSRRLPSSRSMALSTRGRLSVSRQTPPLFSTSRTGSEVTRRLPKADWEDCSAGVKPACRQAGSALEALEQLDHRAGAVHAVEVDAGPAGVQQLLPRGGHVVGRQPLLLLVRGLLQLGADGAGHGDAQVVGEEAGGLGEPVEGEDAGDDRDGDAGLAHRLFVAGGGGGGGGGRVATV